jgi:hypothetical protein
MTVKELRKILFDVEDQDATVLFWTWKQKPYGAFVGYLQPTLNPDNQKGFYLMSATPEHLIPEGDIIK